MTSMPPFGATGNVGRMSGVRHRVGLAILDNIGEGAPHRGRGAQIQLHAASIGLMNDVARNHLDRDRNTAKLLKSLLRFAQRCSDQRWRQHLNTSVFQRLARLMFEHDATHFLPAGRDDLFELPRSHSFGVGIGNRTLPCLAKIGKSLEAAHSAFKRIIDWNAALTDQRQRFWPQVRIQTAVKAVNQYWGAVSVLQEPIKSGGQMLSLGCGFTGGVSALSTTLSRSRMERPSREIGGIRQWRRSLAHQRTRTETAMAPPVDAPPP